MKQNRKTEIDSHEIANSLFYMRGTIPNVHCSYVLQQISWHSDKHSSLAFAYPSLS
jgi:hypothetical protein